MSVGTERDNRARKPGRLAPASPALALMADLAPAIPALAIAFPLIIWPLTEGRRLLEVAHNSAPPPNAEPGLLNRIYFPLLLLWSLASFLTLPRDRLRLFGQACLILVGTLLVWAAITALWALEPALVVRRTLQQLVIVGAIVLAVLGSRRPEQVILPFLAVCAATVVINLAAVVTMAPGPLGHQGLYPQKNFLGAVMVIAIITGFACGASLKPPVLRWGSIVLTIVAFGILVASRSKTSLALALAAPAVGLGLLLGSRVLSITPAFLLPAFMLVCFGVYQVGAHSYIWDFESFATVLFGDPTLSGRTSIWAFAIEMIERKPWFGWGYDAFWRYGYDSPSTREGPGFVALMPHAHNGYLDVWLYMGIVGFALLMLILVTTLASAHRVAARSPLAALFVLTSITFAVNYNFLESTWFIGWNMINMLFILALALVARFGGREP